MKLKLKKQKPLFYKVNETDNEKQAYTKTGLNILTWKMIISVFAVIICSYHVIMKTEHEIWCAFIGAICLMALPGMRLVYLDLKKDLREENKKHNEYVLKFDSPNEYGEVFKKDSFRFRQN